MNWLEDIPTLPVLAAGGHKEGEDALCAMELVAFMERLPHSDQPECTCSVLAAYVRALNDGMPDDQRQRLLPYLARLVGTVDPSKEKPRAEMMAIRAVNVFAVKACRGQIDDALVDAMANAADLVIASAAANAASNAAANAAYAASNAAAYAADSAAANAAYAADSAAANAAANAAYAAAKAVTWDDALQLLDDAIGDTPAPSWEALRAIEAAALTS